MFQQYLVASHLLAFHVCKQVNCLITGKLHISPLQQFSGAAESFVLQLNEINAAGQA